MATAARRPCVSIASGSGPAASWPRGWATVAGFLLCAEAEEKARELRTVMDLLLRFGKGERGSFPTMPEVAAYRLTPEDHAHLAFNRNRVVSGTPVQVHAQLTAMAAEYGVDEITAVTITASFDDQLRSYELLADAFGLAPIAAEWEAALA